MKYLSDKINLLPKVNSEVNTKVDYLVRFSAWAEGEYYVVQAVHRDIRELIWILIHPRSK